jgi:GH25 family lysozyme M1 (1,4-beta-N-acetylmuramidase)
MEISSKKNNGKAHLRLRLNLCHVGEMKKILITFLLLIFTLSAFGQIYEKTKKEGEKVEKARTRLKKRFNISTIDYICDYYCYKEENIDSLSTFLDNLIKNYPNRTELYLYRAFYLYREHDFSNKFSFI